MSIEYISLYDITCWNIWNGWLVTHNQKHVYLFIYSFSFFPFPHNINVHLNQIINAPTTSNNKKKSKQTKQ